MIEKLQNLNQKSEEALDLLVQIWVRFVLACSSLLVFFVDPTEAGLPSQFTHMLMISYCLYSACFVFVYDMELFRELAAKPLAHWIDAIFFSCLIALTGGSDSIFFLYLFFPIIAASFFWGFNEGIRVSIAAVFLFSLLGIVVSLLPGQRYDLGESILRSIYLCAFGYMMAHWGRGRIILKRRLKLLQEVSMHWNPRFGIHHTITANVSKLVEFFRGNRGMLVIERADRLPRYQMYVADLNKQHNPDTPQDIAETTARELLKLPNSLATGYESHKAHGIGSLSNYIAYDANTLDQTDRYVSECRDLSNLFDGESFISVPYRQQGLAAGRIYLLLGQRTFNQSDIAFAHQVAHVLSSVVENMLLIESLIAEAGGQERHRISLDVHDTTIQPYIALTLALDALSREFNDNPTLTERITEIINMANMTIQDLRSYKDTLREKSLMRGDFLVSAIRNQAARLQRFYGINIEVQGSVDPNLDGKLAEASLQIIKEGLSNILRHTNSKQGFVSIQSNPTHLLLHIGNKHTTPATFKPKSIFERALSLGGEALVENSTEGYTVVCVTIPILRE